MRDQSVADEGLTESEPNLLQVAGVASEHGDLTPGQPGAIVPLPTVLQGA